MTAPLCPHLAPLTFAWGFLQTGLSEASETLRLWMLGIDHQSELVKIDRPLDEVLQGMQPLTLPATKYLLVATQVDWVACFDNCVNGADLGSLMTVLSTRLKCRGIVTKCSTDKRMYSIQDREDHFTHLGFEVYSPGIEQSLGPTRFVSLSQYYGRWKFRQGGKPLPQEDVTEYAGSPIQRRLTLERIDDICQSFGLSPFEVSFYLNHSSILLMKGVTKPAVSRSLVEAQAYFCNNTPQ